VVVDSEVAAEKAVEMVVVQEIQKSILQERKLEKKIKSIRNYYFKK
jgi:hypothetical protein